MSKFKKIRKIVLTTGIAGLVGVGAIWAYVKSVSHAVIYKDLESVPAKYVGIVFGAGIRRDGKPSKYLKDRLDAGVLLYKNGKVKRILLSGDNGSNRYDELKVMKEYCVDAGIPPEDIFVDYAGFDTYSTVYRAKDLFKVDDAIMVTQAYHLERSVFLGEKMGISCVGFAADKGDYQLATKNEVREQLALVKSFVDVSRNRKPKYTGGNIDIRGVSNFYKK
ncbi:MAG: hypothetical protein BGO31_15835 [Bacteroidetes bacterium 43-16]|nr:MAG: hypothetical protein BGO31_15835 [Bacteroidetes bacterium 43-16]